MKRNIKTAVLLLAMVATVYGFLFVVIDLYKTNTSLSNSVIRNTHTIDSLYKELLNTNKGFLGIVNKILTNQEKTRNVLKNQEKTNEALLAGIGEVANAMAEEKLDIKLLDANVYIINKTQNALGSGTWIEKNNRPYILTVAHMGTETDEMVVRERRTKREYSCVVVKRNRKLDLMLIRVRVLKPKIVAKLSNEEPPVGAEVYVTGNPGGKEMVVTRGIISKKEFPFYIGSVPIFFGNSGGAMYYKNKLVGVTSFGFSMTKVYPTGIFVDQFGGWAGLKAIKNFLNEK